jgi:Protein of unknown function (DUF2865)
VAVRRHSRVLDWRAALAIAVLASAASLTAADAARAQGFFDFLFGGSQQQPPPPQNPELPPPAPGIGRVAPAPLAPEHVNEGAASTGHTVAFCVRLCDGEHFPLEQMANSTPLDTCHAICPNSQTKVFFGAEIDAARASDGSHYGDLKTAFLYRKQLVANCTCNGKDAFGLVSIDVKTDPTLRPGDVVSTKEGLETYNGKNGTASAFTPVSPAALGPQLNSIATPQRPGQAQQSQQIEEQSGTIAHPQAPPPNAPPAGNPTHR